MSPDEIRADEKVDFRTFSLAEGQRHHTSNKGTEPSSFNFVKSSQGKEAPLVIDVKNIVLSNEEIRMRRGLRATAQTNLTPRRDGTDGPRAETVCECKSRSSGRDQRQITVND